MYYANVSYAKCPEWIKIVNHINNTEPLRGRHSPQMTFYLHDESVLRDDVKQTKYTFPILHRLHTSKANVLYKTNSVFCVFN